ncbi:hypothetical protein H181DRAFT_04280 [Streptomyces sp. WMMB 714]|nr:hypothetical protein [Streptomyces sp. WMMB 714]SCK47877.1 hypothetical protein H181DRAFT_04280 [Streptomyces sp. WMMB 714]
MLVPVRTHLFEPDSTAQPRTPAKAPERACRGEDGEEEDEPVSAS